MPSDAARLEGLAHAVVAQDDLGEVGNAVALDDRATREGVAAMIRREGKGETGSE